MARTASEAHRRRLNLMALLALADFLGDAVNLSLREAIVRIAEVQELVPFQVLEEERAAHRHQPNADDAKSEPRGEHVVSRAGPGMGLES